jgi:hypothetical protein
LAAAPVDATTQPNRAVDGPVLDIVGARTFRLAAGRLARERPQTDGASEAAREAAQALLSLAESEDEGALRRFLRPDPDEVETTWTVACYQIGDLTPCALLDFADPVAAVKSLGHCDDPSHVAAELVASTASGKRWTALTRTGQLVSFQVPDGRSSAAGAPEEPSLATRHWQDQLNRWATEPADRDDEAWAAPSSGPTRPRRPRKSPTSPLSPAALAGPGRGADDLEKALELVVATLHTVEAQSRAAGAPNHEILNRLDALDRRMGEFEAAFEAAFDRRIQVLASYNAELTRAFFAQQSAVTARLEARLDELMAHGATSPGAAPLALPGGGWRPGSAAAETE